MRGCGNGGERQAPRPRHAPPPFAPPRHAAPRPARLSASRSAGLCLTFAPPPSSSSRVRGPGSWLGRSGWDFPRRDTGAGRPGRSCAHGRFNDVEAFEMARLLRSLTCTVAYLMFSGWLPFTERACCSHLPPKNSDSATSVPVAPEGPRRCVGNGGGGGAECSPPRQAGQGGAGQGRAGLGRPGQGRPGRGRAGAWWGWAG